MVGSVPNRWPVAQGRVRNSTSNPEGVSPRDLTYCSHKPECIGTTNPDRSVLITIIIWHFQFYHVDASNLHVKGAYTMYICARSEGRFTRSSHCYVTWNDGNCRLTIPVVKGCCAREALPHTFDIGVSKYGKSNPTIIKHIYNESENLMKVVTLLLTAIIGGIFHKQCQWVAWRVWWQALSFVTNEITWRRAYVA